MVTTASCVQDASPRYWLLRRALAAGHARIGHVVGIEPGIAPAVLVVFGEARLRERGHAVERSGGARVPQRLNPDILVIAGVIHLVELVAAAELGADRVPQQ